MSYQGPIFHRRVLVPQPTFVFFGQGQQSPLDIGVGLFGQFADEREVLAQKRLVCHLRSESCSSRILPFGSEAFVSFDTSAATERMARLPPEERRQRRSRGRRLRLRLRGRLCRRSRRRLLAL